MRTLKLKRVPEGAALIGTGVFSWGRDERVSDRYRHVMLMGADTDSRSEHDAPVRITRPAVSRGRLVAEIVETRQSTHIGDLFRGIAPRTPNAGDVISLCEQDGALEFGRCDDYDTIGIAPDDGRHQDWLNPRALYDCHEQTVRLWFVPEDTK